MEPLKAQGAVAKVDRFVALSNVLDLMKVVVTTKPATVLLACHSAPGGLQIQLLPGVNDVFLQANGLSLLGPGNQGGPGERSIAAQLKLPAAALKAAQEAAEAVRKKPPDRVIIRGCQVGLAPEVLRGIKTLFGCQYVCAPTKPLFFGRLPIRVQEGTSSREGWAAWLQNHPAALREEGFAWQITQQLEFYLRIEAWADSPEALSRWVSKHFGSGGFVRGSDLAWEGIRADRLVFPHDPDYRDHLQSA